MTKLELILSMIVLSVYQVSKDCTLTVNPELGEQAMLIRNGLGDWGIVLGRWRDRGDGEGEVVITLSTLADQRSQEYVVSDDEMQTMELGDVRVDMPTGRIVLGPNCTDIGK